MVQPQYCMTSAISLGHNARLFTATKTLQMVMSMESARSSGASWSRRDSGGNSERVSWPMAGLSTGSAGLDCLLEAALLLLLAPAAEALVDRVPEGPAWCGG